MVNVSQMSVFLLWLWLPTTNTYIGSSGGTCLYRHVAKVGRGSAARLKPCKFVVAAVDSGRDGDPDKTSVWERRVSEREEEVSIIKTALRNVGSDAFFTEEEVPTLAHLRSSTKESRQSALVSLLKQKESDLREALSDLREERSFLLKQKEEEQKRKEEEKKQKQVEQQRQELRDELDVLRRALLNVEDVQWFIEEIDGSLAYLATFSTEERRTELVSSMKVLRSNLAKMPLPNDGSTGSLWNAKEPDSDHPIPWGTIRFDFSDPGSFKKAGEDCRYFLVDEDTSSLAGGRWVRVSYLDDFANQLVTYSRLVSEMDHNLSMGNEAEKDVELKEGECRVQHLGHSVIVEKLTANGLEIDAAGNPEIFIRKPTRKLIKEVMSFLTVEGSRGALVIGQPGTGKTRSGMMLMLQQLLEKGAAVIRLNYKEQLAHAFLPKADSQGYRVWEKSINAMDPFPEGLTRDQRMILLVDPPEEGPYAWTFRARTVKFCSNNEAKHYSNANKDARAFFYTDMPTRSELEVMTPFLWSEKSEAPDFCTTNRDQEVTRRCRVVGLAPRYVFNFEKFKTRAEEVANDCSKLFRTYSVADLAEALFSRPKMRLQEAKGLSTASSRIYFLDSPDMKSYVLTMNPSCKALLYLSLLRELSLKTEVDAKEFESLVGVKLRAGGSLEVCDASEGSKGGRFATKQFQKRGFSDLPPGGLTESDMRELIQTLDGKTVLSTKSVQNYPVADFALSPTEWVNAKSGGIKLKYSTLEREMKMSNISSLTLYLAVRDKQQAQDSIFSKKLNAEEKSAKDFLDGKLTIRYLICFPKRETTEIFLEDYDEWGKYDELDIVSQGVYMQKLYEQYNLSALGDDGNRDKTMEGEEK